MVDGAELAVLRAFKADQALLGRSIACMLVVTLYIDERLLVVEHYWLKLFAVYRSFQSATWSALNRQVFLNFNQDPLGRQALVRLKNHLFQ